MTSRPSQLQQDAARAMNLLAHPMASWAAASAVGLGVATQAWGMWFGAVAGAMESARRAGGDTVPTPGNAETVAAVKARAAAVNLMADAQSLAREVATEVPRTARARNVGPARRAEAPRAAVRSETARAEPSARPAAAQKPKRPDDLKRIPGVGPKLEQVLNGLGVWTYGQVAGWSDADVAWVEDQLGLSGRVSRDGWVAEAANLAKRGRKGT